MKISTLTKPSFYLPSAMVLFVLFLVAKLPAQQLIARLTLPQQVQIAGVSGTIWHGHAEFVQYNGLQLNNVSWQLSWLPLFWGTANVELKAGNRRDTEQIAVHGNIAISMSTLSANELTIYAPAPLLLSRVALPVPVKAGGRVKVELAELSYHQEGCLALQGTGSWLNATMAGRSGDIEFGNFDAQLHCQQGPITITTEPQNSLNMQAIATIPHNGEIGVKGQFKVSDALPQEVHNQAQYIGDIDAEGNHHFAY